MTKERELEILRIKLKQKLKILKSLKNIEKDIQEIIDEMYFTSTKED